MFYASLVSALINLGKYFWCLADRQILYFGNYAHSESVACAFAVLALHSGAPSLFIELEFSLFVLWGILAVFSAWSRYAWIKIHADRAPAGNSSCSGSRLLYMFCGLNRKGGEKENVTVVAYISKNYGKFVQSAIFLSNWRMVSTECLHRTEPERQHLSR